ncbi:ATP-binding protein [Streptomyces aculeolatus]
MAHEHLSPHPELLHEVGCEPGDSGVQHRPPGAGVRHRSRTFARSAAAVRRARSFVGGCILGCTPELADDIQLCVSELVTNAIQHTPAGRRFLVQVIGKGSVIRIEVHDASADAPRLCTPGETDDRGRGLLLVDSFADAWGVTDRTGPGKVVWAEFKIRPTTVGTAC